MSREFISSPFAACRRRNGPRLKILCLRFARLTPFAEVPRRNAHHGPPPTLAGKSVYGQPSVGHHSVRRRPADPEFLLYLRRPKKAVFDWLLLFGLPGRCLKAGHRIISLRV